MVPFLTSPGRSFKGAGAYYLHDKGASTRERVAWTHTENLLTDDPEAAVKVMAYTAIHQSTLKDGAGVKASGRKLEKPVFAFSLAWHPEERPGRDRMLETAREAVRVLGLEDHQAIYVAHDDVPHAHVHVIVNRVHPETGRAATLSRSKRRIQDWALGYERAHDQLYCPRREENARARRNEAGGQERGRQGHDPVIQEAWARSDSGRAFAAALEAEGYTLAQGNKRIVVVDRWGKAHNPARHLAGVKAKDIKARLSDIDTARLPDAEALQRSFRKGQEEETKRRAPEHRETKREPEPEVRRRVPRPTEIWDRERATIDREKRLEQAAEEAGRRKAEEEKKREEQERRREAAEAWAARLLNETADRHREEMYQQGATFDRIAERKKDELERYYERDRLCREIARLKKETEKQSLMSRITGKATRDRETLEALELQLADVDRRMGEQLGYVAATREREAARLARRHEQERRQVQELIARRESALQRPPEPARERIRRRERTRDHGLEM